MRENVLNVLLSLTNEMEAIDCKLMEMYLLDFFVFVQLVISISMYATAECIEVNIIHVPVYACELEEQFRLR